MNYGFVIDNRNCIGCHACTVACKAEHDVPIGVNRTWVKYVEKGEVYDGKVVKIMNFGAFVELLPGKEALLHISKIAQERVNKVEDYFSVGDPVKVKVMEIDRQGRVNVTRVFD